MRTLECANRHGLVRLQMYRPYSTIGISKYLPVYNSSLSQWRSCLEAFHQGITACAFNNKIKLNDI